MNFVTFICTLLLFHPLSYAAQIPLREDEELPLEYYDHFDGENIDYTRFEGRISDKNQETSVFKIQVINNNTKFFQKGDSLTFELKDSQNKGECYGHVIDTEYFFFTIKVANINSCFQGDYLRRGSILKFDAPVLARRIDEGMRKRRALLNDRKNYLNQLNNVNQFVWSFRAEKNRIGSDYDKQIVELQKKKLKALEGITAEHETIINKQRELIKELNKLDAALDWLRVEKQELNEDRWNRDHDLGIPVGRRPQLSHR